MDISSMSGSIVWYLIFENSLKILPTYVSVCHLLTYLQEVNKECEQAVRVPSVHTRRPVMRVRRKARDAAGRDGGLGF